MTMPVITAGLVKLMHIWLSTLVMPRPVMTGCPKAGVSRTAGSVGQAHAGRLA
jgi:hypothetical protein